MPVFSCVPRRVGVALVMTVFWVGASAQSLRPPTLADARKLQSPGRVTVSPDGTMMAFDLAGQITVWSGVPLGQQKRSFPGSSPYWSPDSRMIAYYSDAGNSRQLAVWNATTGQRPTASSDRSVKP